MNLFRKRINSAAGWDTFPNFEYKQPLLKTCHVTKIDTGNKFNMAAAAILKITNRYNSIATACIRKAQRLQEAQIPFRNRRHQGISL